MWETISSGHPWQGQIINRTKDGRLYTEEARISPVKNHHGTISHYVAVKHDVSERIRLEEEGEKLRSQLHQAQKMEAVGRLAGGIAHDFNNMLQSIIGFSELTLSKLPAENPIQEYVSEILKAANRSGNLTRQLLAFSRKQKIQPSVLILDEAIQSMLKMLNRLIGENITVIPHLAASSQKIKIDPSQLDQILVNLAVNSRDAITGGGTITIETALVQTSEEEQTQYTGLLPGNYIRLTFKDDGCGIDPAILPHIFESFFTTKEEGKGTGLGLAAIYGAVKQNNGFIYVNSEPGKGTRFLIYFPLYHGEDQPSP
jgi:signal transduction histidine kinase